MSALISTEAVCLSFGGIKVADSIDFSLHEGERLAVIGANGAGKTTFVNICTGYLRPKSGRIFFAGEEITHHGPRRIARLGLGRSFQLPQLFTEHTVRECLQLGAVGRSGKRSFWSPLHASCDAVEIDEMLDLVGLRPHAQALATELPEGHRKLLDVAITLMLRPRLIILDEPTSGVASEEKHGLMRTLMQALDERRVTSWFVEHDIDIVTRYATRVAAWIDGRIAADGPADEVFADPVVRREVLGTR